MTSSKKVKKIKGWTVVSRKGTLHHAYDTYPIFRTEKQAQDVLSHPYSWFNNDNAKIVSCTITLPAPTKR